MNYILAEPLDSGVTTEPVELAEAKTWCRVKFDHEDDVITGLISAARAMLEKYCSKNLVSRDMTVLMEINSPLDVDLPYGPVTAITEVKRKVPFQTDEVLETTEYELTAGKVNFRAPGTYEVTYTAGYETLPMDLKMDMQRLVGWMFQNRGIRFESDPDIQYYPAWRALAATRYINNMV
jgi:uncharacterized phiE125 gp8 family phage protein